MLRIFIIGIINSILVVQLHNVIQAHTQLDKRSLKRAFLLMLIQSKLQLHSVGLLLLLLLVVLLVLVLLSFHALYN